MRDVYDVIVLGAGAAGMTAAAVAASEGAEVLLVERTSLVGGTTAISGGMVWIPANGKTNETAADRDGPAARAYLAATVGTFDAPDQAAFLDRGPEAVAYLENRTAVRLKPVLRYPDYYPELSGATSGGRVLEPVPFDARELGARFRDLRPPLPEFALLGGMMLDRADIPHFRKAGRSLRSTLRVGRLVAGYARQRLSHHRGTTLYLGNALAARLYATLLTRKVDIALGTETTRLLREEGRIAGIEVNREGKARTIAAGRAVIVATGGFSHDPGRRAESYPSLVRHSGAAASARGEGLSLALMSGAAWREGEHGNGFWVPISPFTRADGSQASFPHTVTDRAKPGAIAVDRRGRRFVNEAVSYHEFVRAMLRTGHTGEGPPAFLLCDSRFLWKYGLGAVKPFSPFFPSHLRRGYLVSAASIRELAREIGVEPEELESTVRRFNDGARRGLDSEFGRGRDIYQRHLGDAEHQPNPCVAPIDAPPYYAVALFAADLGSAAGLAADENARVLDRSGRPIPGLYAAGNDMASVMRGSYPGPGITLGPALTFGYVAARHATASA